MDLPHFGFFFETSVNWLLIFSIYVFFWFWTKLQAQWKTNGFKSCLMWKSNIQLQFFIEKVPRGIFLRIFKLFLGFCARQRPDGKKLPSTKTLYRLGSFQQDITLENWCSGTLAPREQSFKRHTNKNPNVKNPNT